MGVRFLRAGTKRPRIAFVLGGGGNLGSVQVGMLKALAEREVVPDVVVGSSVGALNGAATASDPTRAGIARLEQIWRDLDAEQIFPAASLSGFWSLARKGTAMGSNEGLRRLLRRVATFRTFEEARVPLHVVATSLSTGLERWFHQGPILKPILASSALPSVFPPVEIDGEWLVDGGVVDNVPIGRAVKLGATRIYVLHVGNFARPRVMPRRPIDVLLQAFSIARNHRFLTELSTEVPGVELVVLPGVDPGPLRRNDFRQTSRLIQRGYQSAAAYLDARARARPAG